MKRHFQIFIFAAAVALFIGALGAQQPARIPIDVFDRAYGDDKIGFVLSMQEEIAASATISDAQKIDAMLGVIRIAAANPTAASGDSRNALSAIMGRGDDLASTDSKAILRKALVAPVRGQLEMEKALFEAKAIEWQRSIDDLAPSR